MTWELKNMGLKVQESRPSHSNGQDQNTPPQRGGNNTFRGSTVSIEPVSQIGNEGRNDSKRPASEDPVLKTLRSKTNPILAELACSDNKLTPAVALRIRRASEKSKKENLKGILVKDAPASLPTKTKKKKGKVVFGDKPAFVHDASDPGHKIGWWAGCDVKVARALKVKEYLETYGIIGGPPLTAAGKEIMAKCAHFVSDNATLAEREDKDRFELTEMGRMLGAALGFHVAPADVNARVAALGALLKTDEGAKLVAALEPVKVPNTWKQYSDEDVLAFDIVEYLKENGVKGRPHTTAGENLMVACKELVNSKSNPWTHQKKSVFNATEAGQALVEVLGSHVASTEVNEMAAAFGFLITKDEGKVLVADLEPDKDLTENLAKAEKDAQASSALFQAYRQEADAVTIFANPRYPENFVEDVLEDWNNLEAYCRALVDGQNKEIEQANTAIDALLKTVRRAQIFFGSERGVRPQSRPDLLGPQLAGAIKSMLKATEEGAADERMGIKQSALPTSDEIKDFIEESRENFITGRTTVEQMESVLDALDLISWKIKTFPDIEDVIVAPDLLSPLTLLQLSCDAKLFVEQVEKWEKEWDDLLTEARDVKYDPSGEIRALSGMIRATLDPIEELVERVKEMVGNEPAIDVFLAAELNKYQDARSLPETKNALQKLEKLQLFIQEVTDVKFKVVLNKVAAACEKYV
jgi:hypothetical protein